MTDNLAVSRLMSKSDKFLRILAAPFIPVVLVLGAIVFWFAVALSWICAWISMPVYKIGKSFADGSREIRRAVNRVLAWYSGEEKPEG